MSQEESPPGGSLDNPPATDSPRDVATARIVEQFLSENPDWLFDNKPLMERINLRSEIHGATSLLEHQTQTLRKSNRELSERLDELNNIAENNQRLIEALLVLCVKMCEARSVVDIYNVLQHVLPELYSIEHTQLIVFEQPTSGNFRLITPGEIGDHTPGHRLLSAVAPKCSQIGESECNYIFGLGAGGVRSAAFIPIRYSDRNYAICCIGSANPQRYHPGKDLTILDYISKLTSASIGRLLKD